MYISDVSFDYDYIDSASCKKENRKAVQNEQRFNQP